MIGLVVLPELLLWLHVVIVLLDEALFLGEHKTVVVVKTLVFENQTRLLIA